MRDQVPEVLQNFPFEFYGETFDVYLTTDRNFYIRLDAICGAIGIDYGSQYRRAKDDEVIAERLLDLVVETPYQDTVRKRKVVCLNLNRLPYWLGTLDAHRVATELYPRIILYKKDFAEIAWRVYRSEIVPSEIAEEMDMYATPQERELASLIAKARDLMRRIDMDNGKTQEELTSLGLTIQRLDERFSALEARLLSDLTINSEQAWQVSEMLKAVGTALWETRKYGKSESYALVQEDFKSQFGIHIYSALPVNRMDDAIQYLAGCYRRLKPGVPLPDVFTGGHQAALF